MPNANLVAARNQLRTLVSIYNSNFDQYQQATYNETQVRVDFVNPFFQLLGWDVLNEAGLPQHLREVTHEATVLVEERLISGMSGLRKLRQLISVMRLRR